PRAGAIRSRNNVSAHNVPRIFIRETSFVNFISLLAGYVGCEGISGGCLLHFPGTGIAVFTALLSGKGGKLFGTGRARAIHACSPGSPRFDQPFTQGGQYVSEANS